jgi:vacuolar-type H+-ATPase subunit I/STV1
LTSHKLIDINEQAQNDELKYRFSESFCDKHNDEILKIYCFDCKLAVCMMCFVKGHKSHECGDVKEVAEEMSSHLLDDVGAIEDKIMKSQKMINQLKKIENDNSDHLRRVEQEISKRADVLKNLIDKRRDNLLAELRVENENTVKQVEICRQEVEGQMMIMETFKKYSMELRSRGTAYDITREAIDLQSKAKELVKVDINELVDIDSVSICVVFTSRDASDDDIKDLFGEVDVSNKTSTTADSSPSSLTPTHVIASNGKQVWWCDISW